MTPKNYKNKYSYNSNKVVGPIEPFNDRMRQHQIYSDEMRRLHGIGTASDRADKSLTRAAKYA